MMLIFDSHPVQYRVPIWQGIEKQKPGSLHCAYASDCSVRGYRDEDFAETFSWDVPMLAGYPYTVLHAERGEPLSGWGSLTGKGVGEMIRKYEPKAVLLTGMNYQFDLSALWSALRYRIPVWVRNETQDEAVRRSSAKALVRSGIYRTLYKFIDKFFFIGEQNRRHYLRHGVPESKLIPARYCTANRFYGLSVGEKIEMRNHQRKNAKLMEEAFVVGFSGKMIEKKDPAILHDIVAHLPKELLTKLALYFVGNGPLMDELQQRSSDLFNRLGIRSYFSGFVNQSELPAHYLAMDVLVLPSRRMGETWGLVANEALQAGCGVVVSDAVGCGSDFEKWERFRIFQEGSAFHLADAITGLSGFPREFGWANHLLADYSIEATVNAFISQL